MADNDLEDFIRQRAAVWDDTGDFSPGSPFDLKVIQPVVRRLGADPFSLDFYTFALTRVNEAFPEATTKPGDALTDLLIQPAVLLWDPVVREITRIRQAQSLRDPATLTVDEAEALAANIFSNRDTGDFARGRVRIFFAQPQNASVSPANFAFSKGGLHFPPTSNQSISVDEMLFNKTDSGEYYFDIDVVAEKAGDEYNIGPDEVAGITNMRSAIRAVNLARFRFGQPEEGAEEFIGRVEQELTERSMVTLRGVVTRLTNVFPEVSRVGVVGFNDPEMQRDVLRGGGLGPIRASGALGGAVPDGENQPLTRRLDLAADLTLQNTTLVALIGPASVAPLGWVLTLFDGTSPPFFRDVPVRRIVSNTQLDLAESVLPQALGGPSIGWALRRRELTLSHIPGGILFPDGPNGTVAVPDDAVHIGGATDVLVRGADLDTATLVIENLTDDSPALAGVLLNVVDAQGDVALGDLTLDVTPSYLTGSPTHQLLTGAADRAFSLQILDTPIAGTYRVLHVLQVAGSPPILTLDPPPAQAVGDFRWRLLDEIDVDLVEPRETRLTGTAMKSVQGVDLLETVPPTNFLSLGVAIGDTLRLRNGPDAGDFRIVAVLSDHVQVSSPLTASVSGLSFAIFRPNQEGGVTRPVVRITSIDLLDTSGQPVGSKIPYAKPVDARSSAFANFAHGVKADVRDARLGLVSVPLPGGADVDGKTLFLEWDGGSQSILFSAGSLIGPADIADQINQTLGRRAAFEVEGDRFGITILGGVTRITGGTARALLFGTPDEDRTSQDIRSVEMEEAGGWAALSPDVDGRVDVAQVLDGFQIGFYAQPRVVGGALVTEQNFAPEANRHVQVGSRSVGTARVFFLEPTSIAFDAHTRLTTTANGVTVRFLPDPTVNTQRIPAKPSGVKPKDGTADSLGNELSSTSVDFLKKGARVGDEVVIDYVPLTGTIALTDPVANLATNPLTYLQVSIDGASDRIINFVHDSVAIPATSVTRAGVADQINQAVGKKICSIVSSGGNFYLEFEFDGSIVVRKTGTANSLLGFSTSADQNNDSPHAGTYVVEAVDSHTLTVGSLFPNAPPGGTVTRQQFKVFRPGMQRFCATEMALQTGDAGLFYVDVELVSEGTGDAWNIPAELPMSLSGYESDGYWLTTDDPNLSFSPVEPLRLRLSRSILEVGVADDPENATQLSGQNIQIAYERSTLVLGTHNFVTAETERVICSSPLARHLVPYFVRFDVSYAGGSKPTEITPSVEKYIRELSPDDFLEVSDIQGLLSAKGASSITNPVTLVAIIHNADRSVSVERSQNRLNTGRLAAFIPDAINITRRVS